jgi:phage/plasmid primase-like uncharacterized protein
VPKLTSDIVGEQRNPDEPVWRETTSRRRDVSPDEALAAFRQAMQARGLVPPAEIIAGGDIHRCDTTGKNGDGDGAYLYHDDGLPAGGFENHQDGQGWQKWHADPGRELTPAESANLRARAEADRAKREATRQAKRESAAESAAFANQIAALRRQLIPGEGRSLAS